MQLLYLHLETRSHLRCLASVILSSQTWHMFTGWRTRFFEFYTFWLKESGRVQSLLNQLGRIPHPQPRQFVPVTNLIDAVVRKNQVWILVLSLTYCVNLSKSFNLPEPQFPCLSNKENKSTCLIELLKGIGSQSGPPDQQCELTSPWYLLEVQILRSHPRTYWISNFESGAQGSVF